jgi:hypothetical protein
MMNQRSLLVGPGGEYEIRVQGVLDRTWSDWFDGFTITPLPDGETLLVGRVADQAALHGILDKIGELGLPILLVKHRGLGQVRPEA